MVRPQGDPDAGVHLHRDVIECKWCAQRVHQRTGLRAGSRQIGLGSSTANSSVADARQKVPWPYRPRQPFRDAIQQFVAHGSAQGNGDLLGVIQRQQHKPDLCAPTIPPAGAGLVEGCGRQCRGHSKPVGQPGQLVGHHLMVAFSQCADVAECHREPCCDRSQAQCGQRHRQPFAASQKSHAEGNDPARHRHNNDVRPMFGRGAACGSPTPRLQRLSGETRPTSTRPAGSLPDTRRALPGTDKSYLPPQTIRTQRRAAPNSARCANRGGK